MADKEYMVDVNGNIVDVVSLPPVYIICNVYYGYFYLGISGDVNHARHIVWIYTLTCTVKINFLLEIHISGFFIGQLFGAHSGGLNFDT